MSSSPSLDFEGVVRHYDHLYSEGYGSEPTSSHQLIFNAHPSFQKRGVGSILDVGCGRGRCLHTWEDRGYRVAGTEIVPGLLARDLRYFEEVYPYSIQDLGGIEDDAYDLVTFVDVLDHLHVKDDLAQALAHGGRIARLGIFVVVNAMPRSPEQTFSWGRGQWEEVISGFFPLGLLDVREKKSLGILVWKERKNVRLDDSGDAQGESGSSGQAPGDIRSVPGGEQGGAEADHAGAVQGIQEEA